MNKMSTALAALAVGLGMTGSALAYTPADLDLVETYVAEGAVEELAALLKEKPELLNISGSLGAALREFSGNPSSNSLTTVRTIAPNLSSTVKVRNVATQIADLRGSVSIY